MISNYLLHARKLIYVIIFGALVWFISFTIFPENQIIKISVGDISPVSFTAPNYIEVIDEEQTAINKALAVESVNPIYSIDTTINDAVINGVKDMFLAVIEARISETLIVNDSDIVTENTEPEVEIKNLTKLEQIEKITESLLFSTISTSTIEVLVEISNYDLNNKSNYLAQLELEAKSQANDILNNGINNENLNGLRQSIVSNPPYLDLTSDLFLLIPENRLRSTVSEIIAENLVSNQKLEEDLWNNQKQQISDSVEPVVIKFFENDLIIQEGTIVNQIQYNTLDSFGYLSGESRTIQTAALPIIFTIFLLIYFLFWRFNDSIWNNDKEFLLLLTLILIASVFLRGTSYFSQTLELDYLKYGVPISFVGVVSATLLNLRASLVLSLSSALLALAGGGNIGLLALGGILSILPSVFISEDIDRRLLRERIIYISLTQPVISFGIYFFLREDFSLFEVLITGLIGGLVANLAAFSLITYIEAVFKITTNFRLSELADRNHPGLRYLEEKALGTFNHSLVVGTLADRASNVINANAQLARAMAYFHDLGKTENPTMFIENQFGSTNPHDTLSTRESSNIIRAHVTDGIKLAKKFKIPEVVYNGILEHHGDSIMRFFYEKEKIDNPDVDKSDFRHLGRKPTSKETTILMFADALEGACRARFLNEDADEEKIRNVIEEIFNEKISDGQLENSPITFSDIDKIKQSFQKSLEGLYHQRVMYPDISEEE
ncbi:MAG: HDIG domain-containing protein [Candidatus Actinomarina sp.]|nr:HDIG domain-containing protein [Candidatus Actinomarina sp.]